MLTVPRSTQSALLNTMKPHEIHAAPASSKTIVVAGDPLAALEAAGVDFVRLGYARIFDPTTGEVQEWRREPGVSADDVLQMDEIYRRLFPRGPITGGPTNPRDGR